MHFNMILWILAPVLAGFKRINMFCGFNSASSNPINVRVSICEQTIFRSNFSTMNTKYPDFWRFLFPLLFPRNYISPVHEEKDLFFQKIKL